MKKPSGYRGRALRSMVATIIFCLSIGFTQATVTSARAAEFPVRVQAPAKVAMHEQLADAVRKCESWFKAKREKLPKPFRPVMDVMGWPTLATPITWSLREKDKAAYFLEIAAASVKVTLTGAVLTHLMMHPEQLISDPVTALIGGAGSVVSNPFTVIGSYVSYQFVDTARNGLGLKPGISPRVKIAGNWLISVWAYSATDAAMAVLGWKGGSDVFLTSAVFHAMWATINEFRRQFVTNPLFYHMFPKRSAQDNVFRQSTSTAELVTHFEHEIELLRQQHEAAKARGAGSGELRDLREQLLAARTNIYWSKWLRKDLEDGQEIPKGRWKQYEKRKRNWQERIGIALMVVYFAAKFYLMGDDNSPGVLNEKVADLGRFFEEQWDDLFDPRSEVFNRTVDVLVERSDAAFEVEFDGSRNNP